MSEGKKWTSTAGPLQTKRVNEALSSISQEGRSTTTKSGVIGVDEHEYNSMMVFGPAREEATTALAGIAEKFSWTVTRENCQQIIAACAQAVVELRKTRPVEDNRQTVEQAAEFKAQCQQREQQREEQDRAKRSRVQQKVMELQPRFSWAVGPQDGLSEHARGGKNIRRLLADTFPGTDFRVRTDYNTARIDWDLGPTYDSVKQRLVIFERGVGENSTPEERETSEAMKILVGQFTYVFPNRDCFRPGEQQMEQIGRWMCALQNVEYAGATTAHVLGQGDTHQLRDHIHQLFGAWSIPPGAKITGLEQAPENAPYWCRFKFELASVLPASETTTAASPAGVTVRRNIEHDGVEIRFPTKPDADTLRQLKSVGWRWSMRSHCWYKRFSLGAWDFAHRIAGIEVPAAVAVPAPDRFDMAVEDQMAQAAGVAA